MPPSRIRFLRHAEEHGSSGVDMSGNSDAHSLTIRGWQRAGALARFLVSSYEKMPITVFASKIAPGSETKRPQQTAAPLAALLGFRGTLNINYAKPDISALMRDVLAVEGEVIVFWEHSKVPDCVAQLPHVVDAPAEWPAHRYDLVWAARPQGKSWLVDVRMQSLLSGDETLAE